MASSMLTADALPPSTDPEKVLFANAGKSRVVVHALSGPGSRRTHPRCDETKTDAREAHSKPE